MDFNSAPVTVMHIDLNSCFATVEQQANPLLRGKPIAVAAYAKGNGCILAPSVEAKRFGIKTGMRVKEAKVLYPALLVLAPDPPKYRYVHVALRKILVSYTNSLTAKSIDEFVLEMDNYPILKTKTMVEIGKEIKERIKKEVGDWLTVSIGISTNRFLAKQAAGLKKPDGLDVIDKTNFLDIYSKLELTDLTGIKIRNSLRLNNAGIYTVTDFYKADIWKLRASFNSITGYYWHTRLHGFGIDDFKSKRSSYGNSYSCPRPVTVPQIGPILTKLVEKMSFRIRKAGLKAQGVHVGLSFRNHSYWHKGVSFVNPIFDSRDFYKIIINILKCAPNEELIRNIEISSFKLVKEGVNQLEIFTDVEKNKNLILAKDTINEKWGNFTLSAGTMVRDKNVVLDRIAFGNLDGVAV